MCNYSDYVLNKGIKQGNQQTAISDIKSLMNNLNMTSKQAMDALSIPDTDQEKYAKMLSV